MSYDNSNSGILGKNERMREGKKDPILTGSAVVAGVEYWVDAWLNEAKQGKNTGRKFYSLKFREKQQRQQPREEQPRQQRSAPPPPPAPELEPDEEGDEIPF